MDVSDQVGVTGRCYCGARRFSTEGLPSAVAYCHCADCRRVTGAPVAAFAAFPESAVRFAPDDGRSVGVTPGVRRSFCPDCGSPLTGRYDYLPGMIYVPLGLIDQAGWLPPTLHAHAGQCLPWLRIDDGLERVDSSARGRLGG
ncbi:GFA family protein [Acidimangrovimonas sediminis]|uniref:GFA family protein n=1 Tax=Acidimangrovimonas sediminis TaxID=2056283 RepID=UPI000C7F7A2F|nr:GFA family protein [Acidimangrovimonas sediminis]